MVPHFFSRVHRTWREACGGLLLALLASTASAADFFLYLDCDGKIAVENRSALAHASFAFRDNNMTVLVQKSNVLPVGERFKYDASPTIYSMTYVVPHARAAYIYDWFRGELFVWEPSLKMVTTIRLSIDRRSGELDAELLNVRLERLATTRMTCRAVPDAEQQEVKF